MSSYTIEITSKAQKDLKKLNPAIRSRIEKEILKLELDQKPQQFKPLMGRKIAQYRIRVGDYRVLYDLYPEDNVVLILRIGHRKEIYR
ncbi:type II toxin-antitoxin system RelE/ParE family toxin [Candidatus Roizmanbacteria bacterium]|nr:type II toxin-antitoxin system RelE/ParE family toxin [Candidatus Roizmanbacteria bacterium]